MDKEKHPLSSVESKPLQPVWDALSTKQDKIESSDQIVEGSKNLFMSGSRVKAWFDEYIKSILGLLDQKQNVIKNADEIPEGFTNKYFSVFEARQVYTSLIGESLANLKAVLDKKQDKILSSDLILEGDKHLFFSDERAKSAVATSISDLSKKLKDREEDLAFKLQALSSLSIELSGAVKALEGKVAKLELIQVPDHSEELSSLKNQIEAIKGAPPVSRFQEEPVIQGASKTLTIVSDVTTKGIQLQDIEIRGGKISRIFPALPVRPIK